MAEKKEVAKKAVPAKAKPKTKERKLDPAELAQIKRLRSVAVKREEFRDSVEADLQVALSEYNVCVSRLNKKYKVRPGESISFTDGSIVKVQ